MARQSDMRSALKRLKLLVYNPKLNVDSFRGKIEEAFACPILPNHVDRSEQDYGGVPCDLLAPEIYSSRRVIVYVHGGSFVAGSRASWRGFCARLANKSFSRVILPEFRLAPAHPYPAALEDLQAAFRVAYTELQVARMLDARKGEQLPRPEMIIAADGSGASIALALLFQMKERERADVARVVLLSPWLDFTESPRTKGKKKSDGLIDGDTLFRCGEAYTYMSNLANPLVSPLKAGENELANFPPVYIQCGENELTLDDARQFQNLLTAHGSDCELDVWQNMPPFFQFADDFLWETHLAIGKIGEVVASQDSGAGSAYENKPPLEDGINVDA